MESNSRVSLLGRSKDRAAYYFSIDGKNVALDLIKATHLIKETPAKERNCAIRNTVIVMKAGHGEVRIIEDPSKGDSSKVGATTIRIVTRHTGFKNKIWSHDRYFLTRVAGMKDLFIKNPEPLESIDKARILEIEQVFPMLAISTPFGVGDVTKLSTGCKAVYNAIFIRQHFPNEDWEINIDECGDNVFPYLFKVVAGSRITLYLTRDIDIDFIIGSEYKVYLNGQQVKNTLDLLEIFGELIKRGEV